MSNQLDNNNEMPAEFDFSGTQRGRFFREGTVLRLPVYLDGEIQIYLAARADAKEISFDRLVNDLLKKDIELTEALR